MTTPEMEMETDNEKHLKIYMKMLERCSDGGYGVLLDVFKDGKRVMTLVENIKKN